MWADAFIAFLKTIFKTIDFSFCCLVFEIVFNYVSPFLFLPLNLPIKTSQVLFNIMASFYINCISISLYIYVPKYNLILL